MPLTHFPNGVASFGIPQAGSQPVSIPNVYGQVLFVDGTYGSDGNDGTSPDQAFKTIGAALAQATGGSGCTIFVYPGTYTENLVISKNDIALISAYYMGAGVTTNFRPIIEGGSGVALTLSKCYRFHCVGFYIHSTGNSGTNPAIQTNCEGACFENCEIDSDTYAGVVFYSSTTDNIYTGSGTSFLGCIFDGSVNGILQKQKTGSADGNATNVVIDSCQFYGNSGADISDGGVAWTAETFNSWLVKNSSFQDVGKATYLAMNGTGGATTHMCAIANNFIANNVAASATQFKIAANGMAFNGNANATGVINGSAFPA
jgi:hypothetical protein